MARILGIAGSLRELSYNRFLLRSAHSLLPEGSSLSIGDISQIPLYNQDLEDSLGLPASVTSLKEQIAKSGALLLVTPEYNQSIPGVMKNAIDWCSRPPSDIARVFLGKPVAIMGATPGRAGTRLAQTSWLPIFRALGLNPCLRHQLYIDNASKIFDKEGILIDEKIKERIEHFLADFVDFINRLNVRA